MSEPTIFRMLDVCARHLPPEVFAELNSYDNVIADRRREWGWILYVPQDDDIEVGDDTNVPPAVIAIWQVARRHRCHYALIDTDAEPLDDLPVYDDDDDDGGTA